MHWTLSYRSKTLSHWKSRIWLHVAFKKIPDTPTTTCWSWVQFQKGQPIPCKTTYAFSRLESSGHKSTPLDWGLLSKILPSTWVGPRMPKDQLSRVAWPSDKPSLFIPVAAMGKCKQINNLQYVSDIISIIIHERITRFRQPYAS